jgi:hypothetical protein
METIPFLYRRWKSLLLALLKGWKNKLLWFDFLCLFIFITFCLILTHTFAIIVVECRIERRRGFLEGLYTRLNIVS